MCRWAGPIEATDEAGATATTGLKSRPPASAARWPAQRSAILSGFGFVGNPHRFASLLAPGDTKGHEVKKMRVCQALRVSALSGLMAAVLLASGCGRADEATLLASARAHLAKNEINAARLQIKTALQARPDSGPARLMLGKLMHDTGEMAAAEAELQRALQLRVPEDQVLPLLAGSMVALQKGRALVQQYGKVNLGDATADAELKTQLAIAEAMDGNLPEARSLQAAALARLPDHAAALLLGARLTAADGDAKSAAQQVDALLAKSPKLADAWTLKAELLLRGNPDDKAGALAAYQQALSIQPDLVSVHNAIILLHLATPDFDAANRQFALMQKAAPKNPQTYFLNAVLAEQRGDYKSARELTQHLLRGTPDNPQLLLLAGQVEFKLNALAQAEVLFAKAVQLVPKAATPRHQLAQVQIRAGQPDKAIATLRPLVDGTPPDAKAITLMAQAQMLAGDSKAADASFAKAAKLQPTDKRVRTSIALSQLAKGPDASALAELQSIADADKGAGSADLALISAKVRAKDFTGALKSVDALAVKLPSDALPDQLRGRIALQRGDSAGARKHFEAALVKAADYMPALAGLAALDLSEKNAPAAKARFDALLVRSPKNTGAMLARAEINARSGGSAADTTRWLEKAVKTDPSDLSPRLLLIDQLMASRQPKAALAAAQAALAALPDNTEVLDRLGRAQLTLGDAQQGVSTYNKLASLVPKSPLPQLRLADAQALAKNPAGVAAAVRKAAEIAPQSPLVQQAQINLAMADNKPAQALALARTMQTQRPDQALGFALEGDIELRQKNWDNAAAALRKAVTRKQPGDSVQRLHAALLNGKKQADADKLAADWRKSNPGDMGFVLHLGDLAMASNKPEQAEQQYKLVLDSQPENMLALNNLAYLTAMQKKPGAVALAERAHKLAPDAPAVMDTLAFCLAAEQQLPRAIELQTKAVAAAPDAAQFRLQLAKLHLQAGDKPAARTALNALVKLGPNYPRQAEVTELLKSTGG